MNVFRIKINPDGSGDATDLAATFKYCVDNNVLGVGCGVGDGNDGITWNEYEQKSREQFRQYCNGKTPQTPQYIKDNVRADDLVWTRGPNGSGEYEGKYYLARVTGEWEYRSPKNPAIDIYNIFPCEICHIEKTDVVPGKVIRAWGGRGKTIQRVHDVGEYSKFLWNAATNSKHYPVDESGIGLFPLLDAWETEDVLALFLQHEGWRFVPNSANDGTTQKYEFLVTKPGGELAWTQVKSGGTPIDCDWYKNANHKVIVWQPNGHYKHEQRHKHVTCIDSDDVRKFVQTECANDWLPAWLVNKARLASDIDFP